MLARVRRAVIGSRPLVQHVAAWAALALVGGLLYAESYQRWGHPIIDLGRDLYLPGRLLEGQVLFRDLLYNYGPTAPYLLAGVVFLAGDDLRVFEAVGVATGALTMLALYGIGLELGSLVVGFGAALLFVVLSFFANTTWGANYVLPYSYAATFGMTFALGSYYLLLRYLRHGRPPGALAGSVLLLLLALFTKIEVGIAIVGVHAVAWWTHRVSFRAIGATLGAVVASLLVFAATFAARGPDEHALLSENLAKFAGNPSAARFFEGVAGLDRFGELLGLYAKFLVGLGLLVGAAALLGDLPRARREGQRGRILGGVLAAPVAAGLVWMLADVRILGASVLVAPILLIALLLRDRRDPLVLLCVLVLLFSPRVLLRYYPVWYGFSLCVPAYLLAVYGLGVRVAERLPTPRVFQVLVAALAVVGLLRFERVSATAYEAMSSRLETPKGVLLDRPIGRSEAISAFLAYVDRLPGGRAESMVVFPEGVSLNYFSGIPNPTAYQLFIPPELAPPGTEERLLAELQAAPPELVVLNSRDLREYGKRRFGFDYARTIWSWVEAHYRRERVFAPRGSRAWQIHVWRRRDAEGFEAANPTR